MNMMRAWSRKRLAGLMFGAFIALCALPTMAQPPAAAKAAAPAATANNNTAAPGQPAAANAAATLPSDDPTQDEFMRVSIQESYERKMKLRKPEVDPQEFNSVFFTLWQHSLLQEAERGFRTHPGHAGSGGSSADNGPRPRTIREISLGGIVYHAPKDWTIWLNGQRVTPDALPDQVLDLKVADDHIDLKWFDTFTNLIFPVRLRSHQRFNLDARIFLPGVTADASTGTH
jgi:hypothetical protein